MKNDLIIIELIKPEIVEKNKIKKVIEGLGLKSELVSIDLFGNIYIPEKIYSIKIIIEAEDEEEK